MEDSKPCNFFSQTIFFVKIKNLGLNWEITSAFRAKVISHRGTQIYKNRNLGKAISDIKDYQIKRFEG